VYHIPGTKSSKGRILQTILLRSSTQLQTHQIAHYNNQQVRQENEDKYEAANKVVYLLYLAGNQVWVKVNEEPTHGQS
jgi:nanoRNase/pAp phosphatase (c-di-AMP/oligoRNAs hydrolase)